MGFHRLPKAFDDTLLNIEIQHIEKKLTPSETFCKKLRLKDKNGKVRNFITFFWKNLVFYGKKFVFLHFELK